MATFNCFCGQKLSHILNPCVAVQVSQLNTDLCLFDFLPKCYFVCRVDYIRILTQMYRSKNQPTHDLSSTCYSLIRWIWRNFPTLFNILSLAQFECLMDIMGEKQPFTISRWNIFCFFVANSYEDTHLVFHGNPLSFYTSNARKS